MARRRTQRRDFSDTAITFELVDKLVEALAAAGVGKRNFEILLLRFGLEDGKPRDFSEIAALYDLSPGEIARIERDALALVRARLGDALDPFLAPFLQIEPGSFVPYWRSREAGDPRGLRGFLWTWERPQPPVSEWHYCSRHGWFEAQGGGRECEQCPCPLPVRASLDGRPRRYCSNACRQAHYRQRRREVG